VEGKLRGESSGLHPSPGYVLSWQESDSSLPVPSVKENRDADKEAGPRDLFLAVPELAAWHAFWVNGEGGGYVERCRIHFLCFQWRVWHRLQVTGIQLELTWSKRVIHDK